MNFDDLKNFFLNKNDAQLPDETIENKLDDVLSDDSFIDDVLNDDERILTSIADYQSKL